MTDFPHTCHCGAPAYCGLTRIECSSPTCRHFKSQEGGNSADKIEKFARKLLKTPFGEDVGFYLQTNDGRLLGVLQSQINFLDGGTGIFTLTAGVIRSNEKGYARVDSGINQLSADIAVPSFPPLLDGREILVHRWTPTVETGKPIIVDFEVFVFRKEGACLWGNGNGVSL